LKTKEPVFPALIRLGPIQLPTYATLLSVAFIGAVSITVWQGPRHGLTRTECFDVVLITAVGGLVGARLTYLVINWAFFRDHLGEALQIWSGGLAWPGGLVLGLMLAGLYGARYRLSVLVVFDVLTLGLAWFTLFLWLGTGSANDVYGREAFPNDRLLWSLSADLPDLYGLRAPRINIPLLGIVWSAVVFAVLWYLRTRMHTPGVLFLTFSTLTGVGGLVWVPLQANAVPYLFRLRLDWLFYLVLAVGGGLGWMILATRARARLWRE
jgi:phosphatidylglycerol:prolipoprotein diacylglycerol transferase